MHFGHKLLVTIFIGPNGQKFLNETMFGTIMTLDPTS